MLDHAMFAGTFVLSRRIARPPAPVAAALPMLTRAEIDGLHAVAPFEHRAWGAARPAERTATALLQVGRAVEAIELEVGPWSTTATELRLRPVARHPERWSGRRARRYFARAHDTADAVVAWMEAAVPEVVRRDERWRREAPLAS